MAAERNVGVLALSRPCAGVTALHRRVYLIGDTQNFDDFDADIEMRLGDKIVKINYPCYIFIPKNVMHCPLEIKRVGKPLIFIDARITVEASVRPAKTAKVKQIKYVAKNKK